MKFGIIVTDDDALWGGEEGVGQYFIRRFEERNSAKDEFVAIHAVSGKLPEEHDIITFDGFLVTGSHHSVNDPYPWIRRLEHFIRQVYYTVLEFGRPRMVGICFGHQVIAKALGGRVDRNPGDLFYFGSCEVDVAEEFLNQEYTKSHFGRRRRKSSITIMKFHGECVAEKPSMARAIGSSAQCKHEILLYGNLVLSTQGHPEYTKKTMVETNTHIMKRIGKIDPIELREHLDNINDSDVDNCTEMVRSFLQHRFEETPNALNTDNSANKKRGRLQRMNAIA